MKRVYVISDTHDNLANVRVFKDAVKGGSAVVIHLGDYVSPFTLRELLSISVELIGIFGNNDGDKSLMKAIHPALDDQPLEVDLNGYRVLALHGFKGVEMTVRIVNAIASQGMYDVVLYGHTHKYDLRYVGKTLVVNPGALSGYLCERPTYGVIDFEEGVALIMSLVEGRAIASIKLRSRAGRT